MKNEIATTQNPFANRNGLIEHVNTGTVAIEQERAIAEAQGKLVIAKKLPRDEAAAWQRVMDACSRPSLAAVATYRYPKGGKTVSGPSIRMAEELARCWGNIDYGIRELSRKDGVSEMEVYAWDLETNTNSSQTFTVKHLRDKAGGASKLTSERDIYEITANMGGRRLRARLLAILPPDLVEDATERCKLTVAGNSSVPLKDRVKKMLTAFNNLGVSEPSIKDFIGKPLDKMLEDEFVELHEIHNAIKQGQGKASDFFSDKSTAKLSDEIMSEEPKKEAPKMAKNDKQEVI